MFRRQGSSPALAAKASSKKLSRKLLVDDDPALTETTAKDARKHDHLLASADPKEKRRKKTKRRTANDEHVDDAIRDDRGQAKTKASTKSSALPSLTKPGVVARKKSRKSVDKRSKTPEAEAEAADGADDVVGAQPVDVESKVEGDRRTKRMKLLKAKRKTLKDKKVCGEIDKLYDLIKKNKKSGMEKRSMREIEKTLVRAFPEVKDSKRTKTAKVIKHSQGVSRHKTTEYIGCSSDSLDSKPDGATKRPKVVRRAKNEAFCEEEKPPSVFSFDRVLSSNSESMSVYQSSTAAESQDASMNVFSLCDCFAQEQSAQPEVSLELTAATDRSSKDGSRLIVQTAITDVSSCDGASVNEHEASPQESERTTQSTNPVYRFLSCLGPSNSLALGEKSEPATVLDSSLRATGSSELCAGSSVKDEPDAYLREETFAADILPLADEAHIHLDSLDGATSSEPVSPQVTAGTVVSKDASKMSPSPSVMSLFGGFGNPFYKTVPRLESSSAPSKPVPSAFEISNTTDSASLIAGLKPMYVDNDQGREDQSTFLVSMNDEITELRDQPSCSDIGEDSFDMHKPITPSVSSPMKGSSSPIAMPEVSNARDCGSKRRQTSTRCAGDDRDATFRESYVLGYLLGSLAVQDTSRDQETTCEETEHSEGMEITEVIFQDSCKLGDERKLSGSVVKGKGKGNKRKSPRTVRNPSKKGLFGMGRAKRTETKAQSLAKKAKSTKPWFKSAGSPQLPPVLEEDEEEDSNSLRSDAPFATSESMNSVDLNQTPLPLSLISYHNAATMSSLFSAVLPLEEILKMVKTQAPPLLAKGFLAFILAKFATHSSTVDRAGLCKGYTRCLIESQPTARQVAPSPQPSGSPLATSNEVSTDDARPATSASNPYELTIAPTYSLDCFRFNCGPRLSCEPCQDDNSSAQVPEEDLTAILATVESSLAQISELSSEKGSGLPLISDISLSSDGSSSSSWSSSDGDYDSDSESDSSSSDGEDESSDAFSDFRDWVDFLAGSSGSSSSDSDSSAFERMPSFEVSEWMLRQ